MKEVDLSPTLSGVGKGGGRTTNLGKFNGKVGLEDILGALPLLLERRDLGLRTASARDLAR